MIDPQDLINTLTPEQLCSSAEQYFKSISDPTPQMAKPFISLLETPEILQNMGLLLSGLHLGKTMTVLDFGAGTCWFSRFLNQLQCQTISCDPSKTALTIGRRLLTEFPIIGDYISPPLFLHFDGHNIDIPDNSIDRIICYDVFHHVPNQEEVISEFARVLKDGGVVGFSEPGRFHSQTPHSQYEMRNYDVLENDIDLDRIFCIAKSKGFTDISCKLLSNMELSLEQYHLLTNGIQNLNLQRDVFDHIRGLMTNKTIFFLFKGKHLPDSRSHVGLSHSIELTTNRFSVRKHEELNLSLRISNTGSAKWLSKNIKDIGVVKIGTHLYDQRGKLLNLDFTRHGFDYPVFPGEIVNKDISIKLSDNGIFGLCIDLVSEGICWFEINGSIPLYIVVNVQ